MPDTMSLPHTPEVPVELYEAARVSRFMQEAQVGRWRLVKFSITEKDYEQKILGLELTRKHPDAMVARAVPPGDYITLRRQMIELERVAVVEEHFDGDIERVARWAGMTEAELLERFVPDDMAWIPVMSDTPAEILEHGDALLDASGAVLITGLGLGCLPHALLTKPGITSIDVIDIDPEVIALTGPYLDDPRVTIHRGSAIDPVAAGVAEGRYFDYVWHDIWTHVSPKNLSDATAEHGISYRRLFKLYDRLYHCGRQGAWALPMAKQMERDHKASVTEEREFRRRLRARPLDEQVEMLLYRILRQQITPNENAEVDIPMSELRRVLDPEGKLEAHVRSQLSDPGFWPGLEAHGGKGRDTDKLGRPNAHLETP